MPAGSRYGANGQCTGAASASSAPNETPIASQNRPQYDYELMCRAFLCRPHSKVSPHPRQALAHASAAASALALYVRSFPLFLSTTFVLCLQVLGVCCAFPAREGKMRETSCPEIGIRRSYRAAESLRRRAECGTESGDRLAWASRPPGPRSPGWSPQSCGGSRSVL